MLDVDDVGTGVKAKCYTDNFSLLIARADSDGNGTGPLLR